MLISDAKERFKGLDQVVPVEDYNYAHFRTKYLLRDAMRTVSNRGILPGELAPEFELPTTEGGAIRLSNLRGKPLVLTFSSRS